MKEIINIFELANSILDKAIEPCSTITLPLNGSTIVDPTFIELTYLLVSKTRLLFKNNDIPFLKNELPFLIELKNVPRHVDIEKIKDNIRTVYYGKSELTREADDRVEFLEIDTILKFWFSSNAYDQVSQSKEYNKIKANIERTVLVVHQDSLHELQSGDYLLEAKKMSDRIIKKHKKKLSIDSPFFFKNQPSAHAVGSGFFIKKDIIVTASHLFYPYGEPKIPHHQMRYISHFDNSFTKVQTLTSEPITAKNGNSYQGIIIPRSQIHESIEVLDYEIGNSDWYIVRLKQEHQTDITDADLSSSFNNSGGRLYSCGHGLALPKKICLDGKTTENNIDNQYFFNCNLDFFGGNSGSPVYDATNHQVIGILVRGFPDFFEDNGQIHPFYFESENNGNEQCQRIDPVINYLNHIEK